MAGGNNIPVFTGGGGGGHTTPPPSSGPSSNAKSGNKSGGSAGSGGGGMSAYERRQNAKQREQERKAAQKYLDQAATIGLQAKALRLALSKKGFLRELRIKLGNVQRVQRQTDLILRRDYRERVGSLENTAEDNEKAAGAQAFANSTNRSRERANAVSEAMAQGAGESDLLRTQEMSLRNWNANQSEVNRSFFDTLTSVNSSLNDLTIDTRTARVNNVVEANADREQLWTMYHDQRSEALTQLGNVLGQQAEYYGLANEMVGSKKTRGKQKGASKKSGAAFTNASREAGKAWRNPGVRASLRNWEGAADFEGQMNNSKFIESPTELAPKRPEGATLRKWET